MKFTEGFYTPIAGAGGRAKDIQVFDDELPGFGCRKYASGVTVFFVKYNVGHQQRLRSLARL